MNHTSENISFLILFFELKDCMKLKIVTKTYANENSWSFGSCSNIQSYEDNQTYIEFCCQPSGIYTLECIDNYGDGWHRGYIQIGGKRKKYCRNFNKGFKQSHELEVKGIKDKLICCVNFMFDL